MPARLARPEFIRRPRFRSVAPRRRLSYSLLLSLLAHALLLSLTFSGEKTGLPGFGDQWWQKRIKAPELRAVLLPPPVQERLQQAVAEQTGVNGLALKPAATLAIAAEPFVPQSTLTVKARPEPETVAPATVATNVFRAEAPVAVAPPPIPAPEMIAVERSKVPTFAVPVPPPASVVAPPPPAPSPVSAPAPTPAAVVREVEPAKPDPAEREAQRQAELQEAARLEAARAEVSRQEALRQEAARLALAQQEAQRAEQTRQEAARVEAARVESEKQDIARQEAQRMEAQRQEAARRAAAQQEAQRAEAARIEAARVESARQEAARRVAAQQEAQRQELARQEAARADAARKEAERQDAARQAAAQKDAARLREEQEEDARRDARRQAMARILNEEAAKRDAADKAERSSSLLPLSIGTARRGRLWGRADPNAELVLYAEAWTRKIIFNTPGDVIREIAQRPHRQPMVTVAIRSDGSVESVTFVNSSGVPEVDEAIRRLIHRHAHYPAFPPALANEFDVIEIRRTWYVDSVIRLY